jgi:hypothetical protein
VSDDAGVEWARIERPRFLAVSTTEPVSGFYDRVILDTLVIDAEGRPVYDAVSWRACSPWNKIDDPARDCGPGESMPFADGTYRGDDVLSMFPSEVNLPLFYDVPIIAEVRVDGEQLIALKEVRTSRDLAVPNRQNPRIDGLLLDGRAYDAPLEPGREYAIAVPLRNLDLVDSGDGRISLEDVDVHIYATAGDVSRSPIRYRGGLVSHDRVDFSGYRAPLEGAEDVRFWLVAVDGDGGTGWLGFGPGLSW